MQAMHRRSESALPALQSPDEGGEKRQIEAVDRVAHLVAIGITQEGGVRHLHRVVAGNLEGAVFAEAHIGRGVASSGYR